MGNVEFINSVNDNLYGTNLYIGLGLSSLSSIFIGSSFIIKKKSLIALGQSGSIRAGAGGHGYLRHWVWWTGLLTMGIGEALNFIAYAFAPATLVTPLGALSIIVTAILSATFLGEVLNILGKVGCGLCILGSTMIVLHSPKEAEVTSMEDLAKKLIQPEFVVYVIIVIAVSIILIFYYSPRYGSRYIIVYISICSLIGGFSVLGCKAIGLAVKETIEGTNEFTNWITWFSLMSLIICVATQMNFLNKALDTFNTSVVTPIYYVFFTICVILASGVLFKEWKAMVIKDIIGVISGFLTVICAIFLLHISKDIEFNWMGVASYISQNSVNSEGRRDCETNYSYPHARVPLIRSSSESFTTSLTDAASDSYHGYGSRGNGFQQQLQTNSI